MKRPKTTLTDRRKNEKRCSVRKKIIGALAEINQALPDGVENIGSSSSQDEADAEETPSKFRKRRKILRKRHKHKKIIKCTCIPSVLHLVTYLVLLPFILLTILIYFVCVLASSCINIY